MEVLKLKNWHYLNYKISIVTISTCASSGKRMRFWTSRTFLEVSTDFEELLQLSVERCGSVSVLSTDLC